MSKSTRQANPSQKKSKRKPANPTWEHPKGSGIKIAEMPNKTGGATYSTSFQVRIPAKLLGRVGGMNERGEGTTEGREIHQRKTKAEAERLAEDRYIALKKLGTQFAKIPAKAQQQAAIAWGMLNEHGIDFLEAARAAIRHLRPSGGTKKLADVTKELRDYKERRFLAGKLDERTRDDFKSRSEKIDEAFPDMLIHNLMAADVRKWLTGISTDGLSGKDTGLASRTVLNYRNTLAEIFSYATAKQYCAESPFDRFTKEEYKALGGERAERGLETINILKVSDAKKLLEVATQPEYLDRLGGLVLRLFCGIRTTEISKLDWNEVNWLDAKPFVHVPAGKAKKRKIRNVEIPENALAWLRLCNPPKSGPIYLGTGGAKGYSKQFSKLVSAACLEWHTNDTRHSYGSYHYALHGDSVATSRQMGHKQGDDVLFAHYRALVTKESAAEYFALVPSNEAGIVTQFPNAATV